MIFYPQSKKFNPHNMLLMAQCSTGSYKNPEQIQAWFKDKGLEVNDSTFYFGGEKQDIEYFLLATNDYIIMAFRGSEFSTKDWKTNADGFKDSWVNSDTFGKVHGGFEDAIAAVWPELYDNLKKLRTNNQTIWITGHSQGSALAILAASKLRYNDRPLSKAVYGIYTFGQPRIGNDKFAKTFDSHWQRRCYRVVNNNDIVPRLPPRSWSYRHVGKLVHFDGRGKLRLGKGKGGSRWQRMWDSVRGRFGGNLADILFDEVTDHIVTSYLDVCEQHVENLKRRK